MSIGFLFDDTLDSNDGVAQYVKTLGAWLNGQGHDVSYVVGQTKLAYWSGGKVYSLSKNIPVKFNGNHLSIPLPASRRAINDLIASQNFDVLHVMMPHSPLMSQKVINRASPNTAIVGTFHIFPSGILTKLGARALRQLYGRGLRKITKVVSVSPAAASFASQAFGLNSEVVPNTVDLKHFVVTKKSKPDTTSIVFLGRLVPRKGAKELLEAFTLLSRRVPAVTLIIAGDGPQRGSLESYVLKNSLEERVRFLGYIKETDKPKLLASAKIACFPSLGGESFGIVLLEAMASGASVVLGGDNPGYRSVLGNQPELLVDAKNISLFADRLESFLSDSIAAKRIHTWQKDHVKQYDVQVVGRQMLRVYQEAIAKRRLGGHN